MIIERGIVGMLAGTIVKGIMGSVQASKRRPGEVDYTIPAEAYQSLNMAKTRALSRSPRYQTARENLESQAATMATRARDLGGPAAIGALSKIQANMMAGTRDIDMAEEEYGLRQEDAYRQELLRMAQLKDKEFELDVLQPNERLWNEYYNSKIAGQKNMAGALDSIIGLTSSKMGQDSIDGISNQTLGGGAGEAGIIPKSVFDPGEIDDFDYTLEDPDFGDLTLNSDTPEAFTPVTNSELGLDRINYL